MTLLGLIKFTCKDQYRLIIDPSDCIDFSFRLIRGIASCVGLIKIESDINTPTAGLFGNSAVLLDVELNVVPTVLS